MTKIVDNSREKLASVLTREFTVIDEIAIASAYFNVHGYGEIKEGLGDKPMRLLFLAASACSFSGCLSILYSRTSSRNLTASLTTSFSNSQSIDALSVNSFFTNADRFMLPRSHAP